jgi:hypothetical protein
MPQGGDQGIIREEAPTMTADWFRHDSGARRDPKLQTLRKVRDRAAIADYWMLIEILTEQKDHRIRRKFFPGIAAELGIETDDLDSLVTTLIDLELFSADADAIWSESHLRRMEALEAKKENYRKGAHKRIRAITESSEDSSRILPKSSEDSHETSQSASNLIYSDQINSDPDLDLKKETVTIAVPIPEPGLIRPVARLPAGAAKRREHRRYPNAGQVAGVRSRSARTRPAKRSDSSAAPP